MSAHLAAQSSQCVIRLCGTAVADFVQGSAQPPFLQVDSKSQPSVQRQGSDLAHRQPDCCEITCSDVGQFRKYKPADYERIAKFLCGGSDMVAAGTMTRTRFGELETATGFRSNPHSLSLSPILRDLIQLPDVITYDWVHSALQQGVMTLEVEAMLSSTRVERADLQRFLANAEWAFPQSTKMKAKGLHKVFDARRVASDEPEKIKASCSELLGLYGVLRVYFAMKFDAAPEFEQELASFRALCEAVDLILMCKRGLTHVLEAVPKLRAALQKHLELHRACYGDRYVRPKHHWLLDTVEQIARDRFVLDAFVIERTHLQVKSVAEKIKNTVAFERSVLQGVLAVTFNAAQAERQWLGLLGRTALVPGTEARVADKGLILGLEVRVEEIVVKSAGLGKVAAFVEEAGAFFLVVHPLLVVSKIGDSASICRQTAELELWPALEVYPALAWMPRPDGTVLVAAT